MKKNTKQPQHTKKQTSKNTQHRNTTKTDNNKTKL